jgi:uncharacterized membrane protein
MKWEDVMRLNSLSISILILLLAIIYLGLLERVLERMRLTRKQALIILLAMVLGSGLPVIPLFAGLRVNLGGMLVPLGVVVYLIITADERQEKVRSFIAIAVTIILVWFIDRLLPLEPGLFFLDIDPLYLPALVAAAAAYVMGRSRRASFIGAFMGVLFIDLIAWGENMVRGFREVTVILGGGGVFGAAVLSGVLAVLLAEAVGEIRERLSH